MISFQCPKCQKSFQVPDSYAGKKARCKACREELRIPEAQASMVSAAPKPPLRVRRLIADAELLHKAFANHPMIRIDSTEGDPPEKYHISFSVKGLERDVRGRVLERLSHRVEIQLGADYPRLPPVCRMLTPIFHPNINDAYICVGDHWTAGERLIDLILRIGEMIAYQAYNIRSPLDGEAAMWADLNAHKLPIDPRPITF